MRIKNKKQFICAILVVISFILVSVGCAYSFYAVMLTKKNIKNNDNNTGKISAQIITLYQSDNLFEEEDLIPEFNQELTFSITNITDKENVLASYYLTWEIEKNSTTNNELSYTLVGETTNKDKEKDKLIEVKKDTLVPSTSSKIGNADGIINTGVTHRYTLNLKYNGKDKEKLDSFKGKIIVNTK